MVQGIVHQCLQTGQTIYTTWRSRFLRYIDTRPNGDALRKCILEGPYTPSTVIILVVPTMDNSPAVPERTTVETVLNMSPKNKAHFELEKEAIHLILSGIEDEIYSTVDACKTAHKMWEVIERNNLTVAMMQVNVQFLQQLQPEWSRFVTIVKQQHKLDEVSYHKLFDILKQYQKEVNELRAERIVKNANPLALNATAQPHQDPYYQTSNFLQKTVIPEQAQKDKEMEKKIGTKCEKCGYHSKEQRNDNQLDSLGNQGQNVATGQGILKKSGMQQSGYIVFNCIRNWVIVLRKQKGALKRVKDSMYHKEKMLLCKQLYFVRTEYQLANMFTKALPEDRFHYLVRRIGMRCLTPAKLEVLTNESA
ncbi:hypothetical protein Tco_0802017 [Tanacetum coccineum]|uniref:Gag-Pol polyprotein n=1 Tax=Tanacetum coccineum TaxID=301880 RepID=A0ABQ4ZXM8_9ASTR